ncbi:transcriptional regulator, partial [Bradyrhizobium sp. INPA01-394B]|nr:transcriptional regulator [Bradyrhizobium campsiandrae]
MSAAVIAADDGMRKRSSGVGGYAIFELRDKAEALAMAKEFMQLHLDHMPGWDGTCEVRAFA